MGMTGFLIDFAGGLCQKLLQHKNSPMLGTAPETIN
jgi:hypothetical protein